jgi:hypothetical protein
MLSSEIRVVAVGDEIADLIPLFIDEVEKVDRKASQDFSQCYPQLQLEGDDWLDFCSQKCGMELMEELIEWLEDNAPVGWNFGQMDDSWVYLKEEV